MRTAIYMYTHTYLYGYVTINIHICIYIYTYILKGRFTTNALEGVALLSNAQEYDEEDLIHLWVCRKHNAQARACVSCLLNCLSPCFNAFWMCSNAFVFSCCHSCWNCRCASCHSFGTVAVLLATLAVPNYISLPLHVSHIALVPSACPPALHIWFLSEVSFLLNFLSYYTNDEPIGNDDLIIHWHW